MLNVALVCHSPYVAGAEKMLLNLAAGINEGKRINPVTLIPNPDRGSLAKLFDQRAVPWRRSPPLRWYLYESIQFVPGYAKHVLEAASAYADLFWRERCDVVVVNTLTSLCPAVGAILAGLPYVMWVHGVLDGDQTRTSDLMKQKFDTFLLKNASAVVHCSDWTREYFESAMPGKAMQTILNWTAIRPYEEKNTNSARLCSVTTLESHKGTETLIRAIALLKSSGLNVGVDIYGDGPLRLRLQELLKTLDVDDLVIFHGRTDRPEECFRVSMATVVPSIIEPFGMVAIESMANGTPVIASRAGGLPEIIEDGLSGFLFRPADYVDLASKIRKLVEDPKARVRMGREGHKRVATHFDGKKSISEFEKAISDSFNSFKKYSEDTLSDIDFLRLISEIPQTNVESYYPDPSILYELNQIKNSTYWKLGRTVRDLGTKYPFLRRPFHAKR